MTTNDNKGGGGWVKLHRSLLDWEWYGDTPAFRLFIHCLLKAGHRQGQWQGRRVPRGSFLTGRAALAKETGLTPRQVRTALEKLESTGEITTQSNRRGTLLTVANYDAYQQTEAPAPTTTPEKKRPTPAKTPSTTAAAPALPFPTDAFRAAWAEWETHRREIKKKLTPTTTTKQLNALAKLTEQSAIACISTSIENGWQGLFPERFSGHAGTPHSTSRGAGNNRNTATANANAAADYAELG